MFLTGFSLASPGVGMLVVVVALLAFVFGYYVGSNGRGAKVAAPKAAPVAAAPAPAIDEESYAVLLAAVSEEARLSGDEIRVVSIKEL